MPLRSVERLGPKYALTLLENKRCPERKRLGSPKIANETA